MSLVSSDPKAETRLYITVNDFEFHVYNRSDLYGRLQELFGLEPTIIPPKKEDDKTQENGRTRAQSKIERFVSRLNFISLRHVNIRVFIWYMGKWETFLCY